MSASAIDFKQFQVHHVGTKPGNGNTTRVKLWFDTEPTTRFVSWLESQCDEQGVQGVACVIRETGSVEYKVCLVIDGHVDTELSASLWIMGVNNKLSKMGQEALRELCHTCSVTDAMAYPEDAAEVPKGWEASDKGGWAVMGMGEDGPVDDDVLTKAERADLALNS